MAMSNQDLFRDTKSRKQHVIAVMIIGLCFLIVVLVGTAFWHVRNQSRTLGADNCPEDGQLAAYIAVLLDASEPFSRIQQEAIKKNFREFLKSVPKFGRVALYVVDDHTTEEIEPKLAMCQPGSDKGASPLTQNLRKLRLRWVEQFEEPLNQAIENILPDADARSSPIMEAVQIIAVKEFPTESESPKMIIMFSDLLQHTDTLSMYRDWPTSFEPFRESTAFGKLRSDLSGVSVRVFYVRRDGLGERIQGRTHIDFWDEFFQAFGGQIDEVTWIEG